MKPSFSKEAVIQNWIEQTKKVQPSLWKNNEIFQAQTQRVLGVLFSFPTIDLLGIKNNIIQSFMEETSINIANVLIETPRSPQEVEERVAEVRNQLFLKINNLLQTQKFSQKN